MTDPTNPNLSAPLDERACPKCGQALVLGHGGGASCDSCLMGFTAADLSAPSGSDLDEGMVERVYDLLNKGVRGPVPRYSLSCIRAVLNAAALSTPPPAPQPGLRWRPNVNPGNAS